jgi:hypothetical protein
MTPTQAPKKTCSCGRSSCTIAVEFVESERVLGKRDRGTERIIYQVEFDGHFEDVAVSPLRVHEGHGLDTTSKYEERWPAGVIWQRRIHLAVPSCSLIRRCTHRPLATSLPRKEARLYKLWHDGRWVASDYQQGSKRRRRARPRPRPLAADALRNQLADIVAILEKNDQQRSA